MAAKRGITNLLRDFPTLASEWDYERNQGLDPSSLTTTYGPPVYWKCYKGSDHSWQRVIGERIKSGQGCPFCRNKKVSVTNCLAILRPDLAEEWHPDLNEKPPNQYVITSGARVWWQCKNNKEHVWKLRILDRAENSACQFCDRKRPSVDYNLATEYPELAREWHPTKNGSDSPVNYLPGTHAKKWWKCSAGPDHEWPAKIVSRTRLSSGCPCCANDRLSVTNSLATKNPLISKYWNVEKNKILPSDVIYSSRSSEYQFQCPIAHDHHWKETPQNASQKLGCPFCLGLRISSTYNLAVLFPQIAKHWDYELNYPNIPENYMPGSHDIMHWKCDRFENHVWEAQINGRSQRPDGGCPLCTNSTSTPELRLTAELSSLNITVKQRYRLNKKELDLFLPEFQIGIEYDGVFYHKEKLKKDMEKNAAFKSLNIKIIRIREKTLEKISKWDILIEPAKLNKGNVDQILETIVRLTGLKIDGLQEYTNQPTFVNEEHYRELLLSQPDPAQGNSLAELFPEIAAEWDYKKNHPLTPKNFTPSSSSMDYWWLCPKCDSSYKQLIASRTNGSGCPFCSGHRVNKTNALSMTHPQLSMEWHKTLNGLVTPNDKSKGSRWIAWWSCTKDSSHIYDMAIQSRAGEISQGCSYCSKRRRDPHKTLNWLNPTWLKEFQRFNKKPESHLKIENLHISSGRLASWLCGKCGNSWEMKVKSRVNGLGCPRC